MNSLLETDLSPIDLATEATRGAESEDLDHLLSNWNVLMLPGWNGSGPSHWQSIWEQKYPTLRRVEQRDWQQPDCADWIHTIDADVTGAKSRVILVAHSLACIAVSIWAQEFRRSAQRVAAALFVTPADVSDPARCPAVLRTFAPIPHKRLPFRSQLIGSDDDPYMSTATARELARAWGSEFVNAGAVGHINCASGNGPWPEGEQYLVNLIAQL